nr:MHYT domain-containing protein [Oculatella sp. LEGE 06141]
MKRISFSQTDSAVLLSWLVISAFTIGTGIWSMHFVAMLAYQLPFSVSYDYSIVILSWIAAIIASGIAVYSLKQGFTDWVSVAIPGLLMGAGIGAMHYIGMAAMEVAGARMKYNYWIVALSVLVAVTVASFALLLVNYIRNGDRRKELKLGAALIMGTAISGLHYTGMAAVQFTRIESALSAANRPGVNSLDATSMAFTIGIVTLAILGTASLASQVD